MENDRLITAIGMMGSTSSAGDGEAVNAFRAASAMLARRGLRWSDVADLAFGPTRARHASPPPPPPPPQPSPAPTPTSARGFTAMFDEVFDGVFATAGFGGTARGTGRARRRIEGLEMPDVVSGLPDIRPYSSKGPIMLDIIGDVHTYGPLVCMDPGLQESLHDAAASGRKVMVGLRRTTSPGRGRIVDSVTAY